MDALKENEFDFWFWFPFFVGIKISSRFLLIES